MVGVTGGDRLTKSREVLQITSKSEHGHPSTRTEWPQPASSSRRDALVFDDVSHRFRRVPAVSNVSLRVAEGEFCTVIGPSGCGKTTCLNMVAGEVKPGRGRVEVLGSEPRAGDRRIGYMFARDALFPWRRAIDNVCIGLEARGVPKAQRRRQAIELLDAVGLADASDKYPAQLSQGMRQRVALARTFVLGAEILLMDEPFAALDAQTRILVEEYLAGLWERERSTVLFVTHDLAEAIVLSDRVILMSAAPGRIKRVFEVPLERPRSVRRLQASPDFHALYEQIWTELEEEVMGSV